MARAAALIAVLVMGCSSPGDSEIADGNRFAAEGRLDEAVISFRAAAGLAPSKARPRELLGAALHRQGKLDDARGAWLEAAQLEPESALAQVGLARIESERSDHSSALDRLDRLLLRQPRRADARLLRAVVLLRRNADGDVDRALQDTEVSLKEDPQNPDARYARGTALLAAKKLAEAQALFKGLEPTRPQLAAWGQARVAAAQTRNTDVIVHLREAKAAADAGWVQARVREDPAFRYLWDDPEFSREF